MEKQKFLKPSVDCYVSPSNAKPKFTVEHPDMQWEEVPKDIIAYLRDNWPGRASDENDPELLTYFYNLPAIVWIKEDGSLLAS